MCVTTTAHVLPPHSTNIAYATPPRPPNGDARGGRLIPGCFARSSLSHTDFISSISASSPQSSFMTMYWSHTEGTSRNKSNNFNFSSGINDFSWNSSFNAFLRVAGVSGGIACIISHGRLLINSLMPEIASAAVSLAHFADPGPSPAL